MGEVEVPVGGGDSPYNGSKSLVTGKRGFSPYFKSQAVAELRTHCTHQSLLTKTLTVTESYEAVAICRLVALHSGNQVGTLLNLCGFPRVCVLHPCLNFRPGCSFSWGKPHRRLVQTSGNTGQAVKESKEEAARCTGALSPVPC